MEGWDEEAVIGRRRALGDEDCNVGLEAKQTRMLVGAEEAVVVTVGRVVWFEGRWEGRKEVALEAEEQEIRRVVTGRKRVVAD